MINLPETLTFNRNGQSQTGRLVGLHAEVLVDGAKRFKKLGEDDLASMFANSGSSPAEGQAQVSITTPTWDINTRFNFVAEMVNMVLSATANSLVITGPGGLGKTSTVLSAVTASGVDYVKLSGYSTPRGLYEFLYRNNGRLVVIDDCDAVFNTEVGVNVLKAALDSYDTRTVSWMGRETAAQDEDGAIPRQFEFTGRVIFISNWDAADIPQPIRSRALNIDLSMTVGERLARIEALLPKLAGSVSIATSSAREAFGLLVENQALCKDINLRTMLNLLRIRKTSPNWVELGKFALSQN